MRVAEAEGVVAAVAGRGVVVEEGGACRAHPGGEAVAGADRSHPAVEEEAAGPSHPVEVGAAASQDPRVGVPPAHRGEETTLDLLGAVHVHRAEAVRRVRLEEAAVFPGRLAEAHGPPAVAATWLRVPVRGPLQETDPAADGFPRNPPSQQEVVAVVPGASRSCLPGTGPAERVQEPIDLPRSLPGRKSRTGRGRAVVPVLAPAIARRLCHRVQAQERETGPRHCLRARAEGRETDPPSCPTARAMVQASPSGRGMLAGPVRPGATVRRNGRTRVTWVISSASQQVWAEERPSPSFPPLTGAVSVPRNSRQVASVTDVLESENAQASVIVREICRPVQNGLKTGPTGEIGQRIEETTGIIA